MGSSVNCKVPAATGLGMVGLGLASEAVILAILEVVGFEGLFRSLYPNPTCFLCRALAMASIVMVAAYAAPRWACSFGAGPILGTIVWTVGAAMGLIMADALEALRYLVLIGAMPAAVVGLSMPLLARSLRKARS